jgi:hypothetical protein
MRVLNCSENHKATPFGRRGREAKTNGEKSKYHERVKSEEGKVKSKKAD